VLSLQKHLIQRFEMEGTASYMNFPIALLWRVFTDVEETLKRVINFVAYKQALKLQYGSIYERMDEACAFFGYYISAPDVHIDFAEEIIRCTPTSPYVNVSINVIRDFYFDSKTDFEVACLLGFCAIKSIIGNKKYAKTNKAFILERMFGDQGIDHDTYEAMDIFNVRNAVAYVNWNGGKVTMKQVEEAVASGQLSVSHTEPVRIKKCNLRAWAVKQGFMPEYSNKSVEMRTLLSGRYQMDKMLYKLQTSWGLRLYSDHSRGFYVSFKLTLEDLVEISLNDKVKVKMKYLAEEKRKAKEYVYRRNRLA